MYSNVGGVFRQPVEHRRLQDAFRQLAVVSTRVGGTKTSSRQVLPASVRDERISETSADDPVVPRRKSSSQQQTLLHHRQ